MFTKTLFRDVLDFVKMTPSSLRFVISYQVMKILTCILHLA
ncbi:hypothetical protein EJK55_0374 [Moraxella catarrhalis]|uniref:Uncharacterized protein n=1 Tax=Moraxella catarrhalis TaxID=480 RepID=A0ABY0BIS7_MORCA|nr:hypothetical protein MCRH_0728 [Moraxella catarrhalis RH4]RUO13551.1 hypothetical protein EJK54_0317 [Moraxella catarrhalis]RUO15316.1 hypothetical protein EJK55_0374 [Moraxella catarrhalis]